MKEFNAIIEAHERAVAEGLQTILTSVVHVDGSAYRRAGARMLIDESGRMTGAISGGCLEGDALRKAMLALHQQQNKLITYDTSDEDDAVIGAQLGCNGIIQVLFEPIDTDDPKNPIELMRWITMSNEDAVLVSLFNSNKQAQQKGTVCAETANNYLINDQLEAPFKVTLQNESQLALQSENSHFARLKDAQLFFQFVPRILHLVIIGAGNDAVALASMARTLGWKVSVQDGRPTHANEARFTAGCQIIISKPEDTLEHVALDSRTYIVLMSHNYAYDYSVLKLLLAETNLPYIGMLGPKKKYDRMRTDLNDEGIQLTPDQTAKIHAPVGLNLGVETPDEIALSIIAEIQAINAKRSQNHLKDMDGPIHNRVSPIFKVINL